MRSLQRRRAPKQMLRERGDNDRQAIAHHEAVRRPSDKCSDRKSVDEVGRLSGNGRCKALPLANACAPGPLAFRPSSIAGMWGSTRCPHVALEFGLRAMFANRHQDGVESMTRDALGAIKNAFRPWRAIALRNYQSQSAPTPVNLMENLACLGARLQVLHWNSVVLISA